MVRVAIYLQCNGSLRLRWDPAQSQAPGPSLRYNASMEIRTTAARSILTEQRSGFLASPPYPFTHTLAPYTGCAFGATTCGMYCYAQYLPNWTYAGGGPRWGSAVVAKENAP